MRLSLYIFQILFLSLCLHACTLGSSAELTISGQVLDEKTNTPIPGIRVRFQKTGLPHDSLIASAVTDKTGRYTITADRSILTRYLDHPKGTPSQPGFRLYATPERADEHNHYKNPYMRDKKGAPYLFFQQQELPLNVLEQNKITQDLKMQAGAVIVCNSPLQPGREDRVISLDVTGAQAPRDHFRIVVYQQRYLIVKPGHPYSVHVLYLRGGADSTGGGQTIKQDMITLKPLDTFTIKISPDQLR